MIIVELTITHCICQLFLRMFVFDYRQAFVLTLEITVAKIVANYEVLQFGSLSEIPYAFFCGNVSQNVFTCVGAYLYCQIFVNFSQNVCVFDYDHLQL